MTSEKKQPKAVVVGGSIAGVSCAHALIFAGWQVVVVEKSAGPTTGSSTGAGLGLEPLACKIISSWLAADSSPLLKATLPLTIDQNQVTDTDTKTHSTLTRDEEFNFRAAHWLIFTACCSNRCLREKESWEMSTLEKIEAASKKKKGNTRGLQNDMRRK